MILILQGDFLAFLKCSPKQMANDTRELEAMFTLLPVAS